MLIFSGQLSLLPAYHFTECVPDGERSRSVVESLFLWFACNSAFAYVIDLNYPFRILFNIDSGFEARTLFENRSYIGLMNLCEPEIKTHLSFGMQRSTRDQHAGHSVTGCFRSSASRAFSLSRFNNSACSLPASFTGFYPNVDARPSHVSRSATKSACGEQRSAHHPIRSARAPDSRSSCRPPARRVMYLT